MNSIEQEEQRLRSLLRAVVPEPPEVHPPSAIHSRMRRGPVIAVLAAAATVLTIAVVPSVVDSPTPGARAPSADTQPTPSGPPTRQRSVNPFRGACPKELPSPTQANTDLPDLRKVRAVRLCADPTSRTGDPGDALVGAGVDDFADRISTIGAPDVDRCATLSYLPTRTSLVFTRDDSSQVIVPTHFCTDLRPGPGTVFTVTRRDVDRVNAEDVTAAFLAALDTQRRTSRYPLVDIELPPLRCDTPATQAPVRPTDGISGGVKLCAEPGRQPLQVTTPGTKSLETALTAAPEPFATNGVGGRGDEVPYLLYRTSRYDVVRLSPTDGGLLLYSWQVGPGLGRSTVVPIALQAVTSD